MANLNLSELKAAFIAAGKTILKASTEVIGSYGVISVTDARFVGRRQGDNNEYIMLRDANGDMIIVGLAKGTPAGVSKFEIKQLLQLEDFGDVKAGAKFFKAYGVIEEEE